MRLQFIRSASVGDVASLPLNTLRAWLALHRAAPTSSHYRLRRPRGQRCCVRSASTRRLWVGASDASRYVRSPERYADAPEPDRRPRPAGWARSHHSRFAACQSSQRGQARGAARAICEAQALDHRRARISALEPNAAHLFFQLVSRRYERGAILLTSNRSVGEWGSVFSDVVVVTAILDRLLHHSHVITIRGDSYRLKEKRRSGLLQKPAVPDAKSEKKSVTQAARYLQRSGGRASRAACLHSRQLIQETLGCASVTLSSEAVCGVKSESRLTGVCCIACHDCVPLRRRQVFPALLFGGCREGCERRAESVLLQKDPSPLTKLSRLSPRDTP